ncbi:TolC family protein [Puia dinghuensis]|uniref:Transporter n=1 Tax=Puia dinghuensis TaxID=1792502 RepID=A0A8J2U7S0_9BACT|nr:TolC family protein [Puia dinghuensis]GGA84162.1 transporter [Puia dinghuensis]
MFKFFVDIVKRLIVSSTLVFCISIPGFSQAVNGADTALTLDQCVDYALKHQPFVNQAIVNVAIARATNSITLAGWLPQVNVSANLTHYNTLPTAFIKNASSGTTVEQKTGVVNTAIPVVSVTQTIFNPALLYAARSAPLTIREAQQVTDSTKIEIVAGVSKTFYGLLLTLEQINVLKEDTARLGKNVSDAYHQYVSGIVDETDYDQAVISLNNSKFQLKQATENVTPEYAVLKQIMGYPPQSQFNVLYDTARMMNDIAFDTTQSLQFEKRIEFQVLQTEKQLQGQQIDYYRKAWLPTLGAFFNYDYEFENNSFGKLFSQAYPYSYMGLSLSMPIFTGLARVQNVKKNRLQLDLLNWSEANLKSQIYSEYTTALANYKSNLYNLTISKDNVNLAKRTYDIVSLQYLQGVVPYLNVITAESNLITSEISYHGALFQLLSSKIDLEKAMGVIVVH